MLLPEPLTPLTTTKRLRGISTSTFFKLCNVARETEIFASFLRLTRTMGGFVDAFTFAEECAGEGGGRLDDFVVGTLENDLAAAFALAGPEIDDFVRRAHHGGFVFDDDDGVSGIAEFLENLDELGGVARVEADARFIQNKESVYQARAEAGGEIDALGFAAREGTGGTIQCQVAESNFIEITEAILDFLKSDVERIHPLVARAGQFRDELERIAHGQQIEVGQREFCAGLIVHFEEKSIFLEALSVAGWAGGVAAIFREQHADMHFVSLRFEPAEISFHAVPGAGPFMSFVDAVVRFAFDDELLMFLGKSTKGTSVLMSRFFTEFQRRSR